MAASSPPSDNSPTPERTAKQPSAGDWSRPLFLFWALLTASSLLTLHEVLLRQPNLYSSPQGGVTLAATWVAGATGAALGVLLVRRSRRLSLAASSWLLASSSLVGSLSSSALFVTLPHPTLSLVVPIAVPALSAGLIAAALAGCYFTFWRPTRGMGVGERLSQPFYVLAATLLMLGAGVATNRIGVLRSAPLAALGLAVTAVWLPPLARFAFQHEPPALRRPAWLGRLGFVVSLGILAGAEAFIPIQELRLYPNEVLYAQQSDRGQIVVTGGQQAFELFVDRRLEVSQIDEHRYAEALTHPALTLAQPDQSRFRRVAILSAGDGMLTREVIRHTDVGEVMVVVDDVAVPKLATRMPWLAQASRRSLVDTRVRVQQAEALEWLAADSDTFDVIVVDLPDPISYAAGKHYTRFFYERLGERLGTDGVAAISATSPLRTPRSHAIILRTIEAAGLNTLAYRAAVPLMGERGFVLAARRPLAPPQSTLGQLRFLTSAHVSALFVLPPDTRADVGIDNINLLHDQQLVALFDQERRALRR